MDKFIRKQFGEMKEKYIQLDPDSNYRVLDVGSRNVNGSLREFFQDEIKSGQVEYTGLDIVPGKGVDYVPESPYFWQLPCQFDYVISSSTFEHIEWPWATLEEVMINLDPNNDHCRAIIGVPSRGKVHNHPVDCWRFYPGSMAALANWTGAELVDTHQYKDTWNTLWGIFKHNQENLLEKAP